MIKRRQFMMLLGAAVAWPLTARGQQGRKVHRIGFLRVGPPPATFMEGFREGLREHGYLEGQNFVIEYGLVPNAAQLPDAAQELARRKVDVLVASGTPSVQPAAKATSTIPVVFVAAVDPLATGVVASLARPGGHVTGVTAMHGDVIGKRLQLLGELLPTLSRIAVLVRANSPATPQYLKEAELAGRSLAVQLQVLRVHETRDLEGAINGAQGANALLVADDAVFTAQRTRIAELALRNRLPTAYGFHDMVEAGGLMAYGPHYGDLYRRAAAHVHKLLNGARPADLPVEQPTRFELLINLKTAKALGLEVPPTLLARADQVIE
jgi:putative tryptophan/tyrosine transport system substrate-binding protein